MFKEKIKKKRKIDSFPPLRPGKSLSKLNLCNLIGLSNHVIGNSQPIQLSHILILFSIRSKAERVSNLGPPELEPGRAVARKAPGRPSAAGRSSHPVHFLSNNLVRNKEKTSMSVKA